MRIVFANRFFHPDTSATSQMLTDLATRLAARGHEVHVIASGPGDASLGAVKIHRVPAAGGRPRSLAARAWRYARFVMGARGLLGRVVKPGDVVVLKTDPPMLGAFLGRLAHARGGHVVNWLQDLFPEVAELSGIPGVRGPLAALLRRSRNSALRNASTNVSICDAMAHRLSGLDCEVQVIHNWADGAAIRPSVASALRAEWGLERRFVVAYSGNLGRVHEFETVLRCAERLRNHPDVAFLFVGEGARVVEVKLRVTALGLDNVEFQPHQPRERLSESLAAADVHLSTLRAEFEGTVHPSKLYGIMAAGRPTLFVGDIDGETAKILAACSAGRSVRTGDAAGLVAAVLALRDSPGLREEMGRNARAAFDAHYDLEAAVSRWESVLLGAMQRPYNRASNAGKNRE